MSGAARRRIAVAFIEEEGKVLIAKRPQGGAFPNLWELPGGKCLDGEEPATCVAREVLEETGLHVLPEASAGVVEHSYPAFLLEIHAFFCRILGGRPSSLASQELAWVRWEELEQYPFPEANAKVFETARRLRRHLP